MRVKEKAASEHSVENGKRLNDVFVVETRCDEFVEGHHAVVVKVEFLKESTHY